MPILVRQAGFGALARTLPEDAREDDLADADRVAAAAMEPLRRAAFVAGRCAARAALRSLGAPDVAIPIGEGGAPIAPAGFSLSISHKGRHAVALAAPCAENAHLGVDIEALAPLRVDVSRRVLTDAELAALAALGVHARDDRVRVSFSIKEAIYKAIHPFVRRYVGFREVSLGWRADASPRVEMHLSPPPEAPLVVEVDWERTADGFVISSARAERAS